MTIALTAFAGEPKVTTIYAKRNAQDYNSIREIIESIRDASESNRYVVIVPEGRWFECDLHGGAYIKIVGQNRDKTILYCDGESDKTIPARYPYGLKQGTPLNTISRDFKHCFFVNRDTDVENLTIEADFAKYCVHIDCDGWKKARFTNCRFIAGHNTNHPIGIGILGGQSIEVENCIIEAKGNDRLGFVAHNWNNQKESSEIRFNECIFMNCGFGNIDELGSGKDDIWQITNCHSDGGGMIKFMVDYDADHLTYYRNPSSNEREADPRMVPYCIKLDCTGSNVTSIYKTIFAVPSYGEGRPDIEKYILTDCFFRIQGVKNVGQTIKGYFNGTNFIENDKCPVVGVVTTVIDGISYVYPIVKRCITLPETALEGECNAGSLVYIGADGFLTTDGNGTAIGIISNDPGSTRKKVSFF